MIVEICLKDPDGVYDSVQAAVRKSVADVEDPIEAELLLEHRREMLMEILSKWIEYGEYVTLVIDTEHHTCQVKARRT